MIDMVKVDFYTFDFVCSELWKKQQPIYPGKINMEEFDSCVEERL
ncbi:MAG: hypothetical protein RSH78_01300 [Bacilli bacterium]